MVFRSKPLIWIGLGFFIFGLLGSIPSNLYYLIPDCLLGINSFHVNISSELLSISFSIIVIDGYNYFKQYKNDKNMMKFIRNRFLDYKYSLSKIINYYFINNSSYSDEELLDMFYTSLKENNYKILSDRTIENFIFDLLNNVDSFYEELSKYILLVNDSELYESMDQLLRGADVLKGDLDCKSTNSDFELPYYLQMFLLRLSNTDSIILSSWDKYSSSRLL